MANVPILFQISGKAMLLQFLVMILFYSMATLFYPSEPFLVGVGGYLLMTIILKYTLMMPFRKGTAYVRMGHYAEAITAFTKSLDFLKRNPWVDQFRAILLGNPSAFSYRELALQNIAFSQSQIGNDKAAKEALAQLKDEFPDSKLIQP